jgi:phosphatidylethanolamine/phosphatidyl-N-methylethanolamine N-methyltransferase
VVTEAILARGIAPERLTAIEFDADFARLLRKRFPLVRVLEGDAFDLARSLRSNAAAGFAAIVSSLPLLNQPVERRDALLHDAFTRLAPGAPFIQFSYGRRAPVPAPDDTRVTRAAFILANLPPASVWVYRRV